MRVKISYGIHLDDLPEEVINLYDSVAKWVVSLEKQSDTIEDLLEAEEFEPCLAMVSRMRGTLAKVDSRLEDLSNILEGYSIYMKENGVENDIPKGGPAVDTASGDIVSGTEKPHGSNDEPGT